MILHDVDKPGSDIDSYVNSLDNLLNKKLELINAMKPRITSFKEHLKEEESLSNQFYDMQNNSQYNQGPTPMHQEQMFNHNRNYY